jgi:tRNA (adenine37-N6)-methyltransferase
MKKTFEIFPVGAIRKSEGGASFVEVFEEFTDGLLGIEQFSHILLFCWFEQSDTAERRSTLRVHPRNDKANPLTGVFATRSPRRPNPIAVYISRVLGIQKNRIEIDPLDAFDGTPVIDIKPYIPLSDAIQEATVPSWVDKDNPHAKTQSRRCLEE